MSASEAQRRLLAQRAVRRQRSLAARLPGGTGWSAREVPMWKRSDVERLTGLTRHMIQDLCNPNTNGDGLGFWEPAISKPGYSRFDEGDLLAFYLVRQLMQAGFTLKEIESAVFDLMEDNGSFERALRRKATVLHRRRAELDGKLSTLEYLEAAATAATDDRLYAVMEAALIQSAERAVRVATAELQAAEADEESVRRGMRELVAAVLGVLRGDEGPADADGHGAALLVADWAREVDELLADEAAPASPAAQRLMREIAHAISGDCADDERDALAARSLVAFLDESENGVPIELVFGEGSFAFLGQAARACAGMSENE